MNALKKHHEDQQKAYDSSMRKPLIFSVAFHIFVVVIGTLGLPYFVTKPEPREVAITIEMAELDVVSQTDVLAPPKESKEPKKEPEPPKETKPKYQQTKAEEEPEETPPEPPKPEVKEEIPEPPKPEDKKEEKKEEKKEDKPKPKPLPPKPKNKPKPPKPKKPKEEKKEEELDMTKLLTSLTDESTEAPTPKTEEPSKTDSSQVSQIARVTGKLTRSEEDNLNSGVAPCWNVNAGGKDAEKLMVSMEVYLNPDMSVRDVVILDQVRYSSDNAFRTAAETARRALLSPKCNKLKLPPEKYNDWKVFTYHFDPSLML